MTKLKTQIVYSIYKPRLNYEIDVSVVDWLVFPSGRVAKGRTCYQRGLDSTSDTKDFPVKR